MKHKTKITAFIITLLTVCPLAVSADFETEGVISKVTVYRGQALVTRDLKVDLPAGSSQIIVTNLPSQIIPDSIYAQTSGNVKVLSVRYREKAVKEDTREEVKKLDSKIESLKREIHHTERKKGHLDSQWDMFVKLRQFVADAKQIDTGRGLLQFEPIKNLAEFILEKADVYIEKTLAFEDEINDMKKELGLLERKLAELTAGSSKTRRQAVVYISSADAKKAAIELNYLVDNANWNQLYNLRANPDNSAVTIEYNAVINQISGEDWDNVTLTLSTAEPAMVAEPPVLEPMMVALFQPVPGQQQSGPMPQLDIKQMQERENLRRRSISKGIQVSGELNTYATQTQIMVMNAPVRQIEEYQQRLEQIARIEGVSVTYNLPGLMTLPSRNDRQLVSIASVSAKADFTLLASPLLTDYVYLQAELLNDSDTVLLPGPASMFCDGRFVGQANIPLVTIGEKFTAGFGIDSQIQVKHELESKKTKVQGGNRIDTYNYRIALNNFKDTPARICLLDRLPYSQNSSIKIDLTGTSIPLSEDAEYVRTLKKKGLLRWDLELEPNTIDEDATIVTYSFTTEYDRNMSLTTVQQ